MLYSCNLTGCSRRFGQREQTAKTLDVMFGSSPLASAVAHGSPSAPAPREFFRDSLLNIVGQDDEANDNLVGTRDSSGGNNPFEEGKQIDARDQDIKFEPSDVRGSKGSAPDAPDVYEEQSLQTVEHSSPVASPLLDPPADVVIPDNYPTDEVRESIADSLATTGTSGLNVIVDHDDEDDTPTDEDTINVDPKSVEPKTHDPEGEKEEAPPSETYCESNDSVSKEPSGEKTATKNESICFTESKGPVLKNDVVEEDAENETVDVAVDCEDETEPEIVVEVTDDQPIAEDETTPHAAASVTPEKEYFKSVSPHTPWSGTTRQSYYDVQELAYLETKKYLDQHENLVKYVEDWEVRTINTIYGSYTMFSFHFVDVFLEKRILFQRVHGLYTEYMKQRKNLQHYIKKVCCKSVIKVFYS